jgi:hypothetical protein
MNETTLFLGVILGAVGAGYFVYGKKQRKGVALVAGLLLCVIPYFTSNIPLVVVLSILIMALPFFIRY